MAKDTCLRCKKLKTAENTAPSTRIQGELASYCRTCAPKEAERKKKQRLTRKPATDSAGTEPALQCTRKSWDELMETVAEGAGEADFEIWAKVDCSGIFSDMKFLKEKAELVAQLIGMRMMLHWTCVPCSL